MLFWERRCLFCRRDSASVRGFIFDGGFELSADIEACVTASDHHCYGDLRRASLGAQNQRRVPA